MSSGNPELDGFIAKYAADIAEQTHVSIAKMRARLPSAKLLVYDNYNALAVGFATAEKVGSVILSITAYPRWVSLFFWRGAELPDPHGLLEGQGSQIRSVRLSSAETLDDQRVEALIVAAVASAEPPLDPVAVGTIIIKSISAKQKPRRPAR